MKRSPEPIPLFEQHSYAYLGNKKVFILSIGTYCSKTDTFLDKAVYTIKEIETGDVHYKVNEDRLFFEENNNAVPD